MSETYFSILIGPSGWLEGLVRDMADMGLGVFDDLERVVANTKLDTIVTVVEWDSG